MAAEPPNFISNTSEATIMTLINRYQRFQAVMNETPTAHQLLGEELFTLYRQTHACACEAAANIDAADLAVTLGTLSFEANGASSSADQRQAFVEERQRAAVPIEF